MPSERHGLTAKRTHGATEFYVTVNFYPDTKKPGEVFLVLAKTGSDMNGFADLWATTISIALQYGVPWESLADKFLFTRFGSHSTTEDPSIGHAVAKTVTELVELMKSAA